MKKVLSFENAQINLAFYSLIRTFAPKIRKYGKKKMALQSWRATY
jgi:hypothetical protein